MHNTKRHAHLQRLRPQSICGNLVIDPMRILGLLPIYLTTSAQPC